jgi:NADPH:quinone reductase-like Zn-dependent oxidoreductase
VKVPEGIDPAQAVCLCNTYLSAFQSLHYGQVAFSRYAENSLEGKTVLIVGSTASTFGKAVIELAVDGNAAIVFATAKRKYWRMLLALGIIPLPDDSFEWLNRVEGTIDLALIVGMEEPNQIAESHERALRQDGRLIICGCEEPQKLSQVSNKRFVVHDVYHQWEKDLEESKRDIQHLIGLLEKEKLRPKVLDRLPLAKVADAQKLIESKTKLSGFLVCEPWMQTKKRALYL